MDTFHETESGNLNYMTKLVGAGWKNGRYNFFIFGEIICIYYTLASFFSTLRFDAHVLEAYAIHVYRWQTNIRHMYSLKLNNNHIYPLQIQTDVINTILHSLGYLLDRK